MKLWVSFFVAAVWALQLPSDGNAKNIRQLPTMNEIKAFKLSTSFATKRDESSELEESVRPFIAEILTLRRKYLSDDVTLFGKAVDAIVESLTTEELESDNLPAIIVSKYADDSEYTEEDAAYFEAINFAMGDPELLAKVLRVGLKYILGEEEEDDLAVMYDMFDLVAGMSIEDIKNPNFAEILEGKMDDFFFNKNKGSSRRASFHNMKRKVSMADNVDHGGAGTDVNRRSNTKNIRQLPTMNKIKAFKLSNTFATKRAVPSELHGNKVITPAVFTLRRKYLSDDVTLFGEAVDAIVESLTTEELESDNLPAIIVNKYADDSEYTEEDAAYFEALRVVFDDAELPAKLDRVAHKKYPGADAQGMTAFYAMFDLIAGMSIEEVKNPKFAEILEGKMDDFFSNKTKGSSRRASFHNMKRKVSMADNVDHGGAGTDVNRRRNSQKPVAHRRHVDPKLKLVSSMLSKRQAEGDTDDGMPSEFGDTIAKISLTLKRKYPDENLEDLTEAVKLIYRGLTMRELMSGNLPAIVISKYRDGSFTDDDKEFYVEVGHLIKHPEFTTFVNNIGRKYDVQGDEAKSDKLSGALIDVMSSLTIAEMKSSNVMDIMEQRIDDIMNGIVH